MDPNETLRRFREAFEYAVMTGAEADQVRVTGDFEKADRLASQAEYSMTEAVQHAVSLDNWLSRGGYLPDPWQPKPPQGQ